MASPMMMQPSDTKENVVVDHDNDVDESAYLTHQLLVAAKPYIKDGRCPDPLIYSFQKASQMAIKKIKEMAVPIEEDEERSLLVGYVASRLSFGMHNDSLATMVVDAVLETRGVADGPDYDYYDEEEELGPIAIHKVPTGTIENSFFADGVVFQNMFSCAGHLLPLRNPKILLLNINLDDPKAQKEIDTIIRLADKLSKKQCAIIVLSLQAIGGVVTKLLAEKNIVCAGLVAEDDMDRVKDATRGIVLRSLNNFSNQAFGTCERFEQKQIGDDVFSIFSGCPLSTATIVLYGVDHQFLAEVEQILHNKIIFVKSAVRKNTAITSGNAIYMEISEYLSQEARYVGQEYEQYIELFAKALEDISKELDADFDNASDEVIKARQKYALATGENSGNFLWEPSMVKIYALKIGTDFACALL